MDGTENMTPSAPGKNGPVIGIIVVIIVLAIGAYYLFAELQSQKAARELESQDAANMQDIEADIAAERAELDAMEAELNADMQALDAETQ